MSKAIEVPVEKPKQYVPATKVVLQDMPEAAKVPQPIVDKNAVEPTSVPDATADTGRGMRIKIKTERIKSYMLLQPQPSDGLGISTESTLPVKTKDCKQQLDISKRKVQHLDTKFDDF